MAPANTAMEMPPRRALALKRSTTMDKSAAARRILMIGSSNFSMNFFQIGSRGSGVSRFDPKRCLLSAACAGVRPSSARIFSAVCRSFNVRMANPLGACRRDACTTVCRNGNGGAGALITSHNQGPAPPCGSVHRLLFHDFFGFLVGHLRYLVFVGFEQILNLLLAFVALVFGHFLVLLGGLDGLVGVAADIAACDLG